MSGINPATAHDKFVGPQNAILRYGRLPICATLSDVFNRTGGEHLIDADGCRPYRSAPDGTMNAKLLLKTIFLIIILLLLVLMGMHNRGSVDFTLPPLLEKTIKQPAALMYFAFFAIGVLTGTIMTAGLGKGGARTSKAEK